MSSRDRLFSGENDSDFEDTDPDFNDLPKLTESSDVAEIRLQMIALKAEAHAAALKRELTLSEWLLVRGFVRGVVTKSELEQERHGSLDGFDIDVGGRGRNSVKFIATRLWDQKKPSFVETTERRGNMRGIYIPTILPGGQDGLYFLIEQAAGFPSEALKLVGKLPQRDSLKPYVGTPLLASAR